MKRVRSIVGRDPGADTASPHWIAPRDPYAGDEALLWPGDYSDYVRHSIRLASEPLLNAAEYASIDLEFERTYRAILDGDRPYAAIEPFVDPLLLGGELVHDRRPPGRAMMVIEDRRLADIAENQLPGVGLVGPDRIMGPWADEPIPRWLRIQVGAVMAFVPEVEPGVPPWARAIKRRPRPETPVRQSLRVMARSAPCLWAVDGDAVSPLIPLGAVFQHSGSVVGLPPVSTVIGRLVDTDHGLRMAAAIPLIRRPSTEAIEARLRLEWLRLRRRERRLSMEDMLRERSEVLYRACMEWLWLTFRDGEDHPW